MANAASLTLAWDGPTDQVTKGYVVVYGTAPGAYPLRADVGLVTTARIDGLQNNTRYYFRVQAYSADRVFSEYSAEVSGTTAAGSTSAAPATSGPAPVSSTATASTATSAVAFLREGRFIDITWTPVTGVAEYRVEVGAARGQTAFSAYTANTAITFDASDMPSLQYFVRVRNVVGGAPGVTSNEETVTGSAFPRLDVSTDAAGAGCGAAPGAPRQFFARATGTAVQLGWQPGSGSPAASYMLQVGSLPGVYNLMLVPLPGGMQGLNADAANGSYALRLYAANDCGRSAWGAEHLLNVGVVSAAATANLAAPGNFTQNVSGTLVTLSWSAPAGDVTRYQIQATIADGTVVASLDTGNPATTFSHPNTPSGEYFVTVRAGNAAGFGQPTARVTVVVP